MHKVDITSGYIEALQAFTEQLAKQKRLHSDEMIYQQSGRKYDKVLLRAHNEEDILFFVRREDGTIFGKKNPISPNIFWWFNTIYTAKFWDWSDWPEPVSDPSVELVHTYGKDSARPMRHYRPIGELKKPKQKRKKKAVKLATPIIEHEPLDMAEVRG